MKTKSANPDPFKGARIESVKDFAWYVDFKMRQAERKTIRPDEITHILETYIKYINQGYTSFNAEKEQYEASLRDVNFTRDPLKRKKQVRQKVRQQPKSATT